MAERSEHHPWYGLPGEVFLHISKLRASFKNSENGEPQLVSNIGDGEVLDSIEQELNHPRLKEFREHTKNGQKRAWFIPVVGGISIIVAAAIGAEVGLRHAKDIKELYDLLEKHGNKGKQT